jgi:hypothetical protein
MQPDLDKLKGKIRDNKDLIDKISSKLPGFKGYAERAETHDTDRAIRELIVDKFRQIKSEVNAGSKELAKSGKYLILPELESLETKLETLIKNCQFAGSGVKSPVSRIAPTEDDRNRLLEYDWKLIAAADDLERLAKDVLSSITDDPALKIQKIEEKLREFEKNFDERKNILLEVR